MLPVYAELINRYENKKVDFADVVVFNLFEFYPTEAGAPSTLDRLNNLLLSKVNIKPENVHSFNQEVEKADLYEGCRAYEAEIDACGVLTSCFAKSVLQATWHSTLQVRNSHQHAA